MEPYNVIISKKENEVLIKVEACGICHGDAITKEGYYPDANNF